MTAAVNTGKAFANPIRPDIEIEVDGKTFRLLFDFEALATAKALLEREGIKVNILQSLDFREVDVDKLPVLFFAAALRHQPKLKFEAVKKLITLRTMYPIFVALVAAYKSAMVDAPKNPTRATPRRSKRKISG